MDSVIALLIVDYVRSVAHVDEKESNLYSLCLAEKCPAQIQLRKSGCHNVVSSRVHSLLEGSSTEIMATQRLKSHITKNWARHHMSYHCGQLKLQNIL